MRRLLGIVVIEVSSNNDLHFFVNCHLNFIDWYFLNQLVTTAFAHRTLAGLTLLPCVVLPALSVVLEGLNVTENKKKGWKRNILLLLKEKLVRENRR